MNFNFSDPTVVIIVSVVVLLIVLAIVLAVAKQRQRRRTEQLRRRFGSEYDLALREFGSRRKAEAALLGRVLRVERMTIRPLSEAERTRFFNEWESVQARFIDHPRGAVTEADEMINSLLQARGYAGGSFDQRAADLSVFHASLVEPYRRANAIVVRAGKNEATTEELRSAMILFRALSEELMQAPAVPVTRAEAA
jgi:hypothetical protein